MDICVTCTVIRGLCEQDCAKDHKHRRGVPNFADENSQLCGSCKVALGRLPQDVADAYALLPELTEPSMGGRGGEVRARDPDPPMPLGDAHDLTWERPLPMGPVAAARLAQWPQDQIGRLSVAGSLLSHVRVWIDLRGMGEVGPEPTVPKLAEWLSVRTGWAVEHHPAIDEYASDLVDLRGLLLAMVGRETPDERPQPLPGVPCVRCRRMTLVRELDTGRVLCTWADCQRIYTEDEWNTAARAMLQAARRGQVQPVTQEGAAQ